MGRAKEDEIQKDEDWHQVCRRNGWVCKVCGAFPPEPGKPFGYESGYCPSHDLSNPTEWSSKWKDEITCECGRQWRFQDHHSVTRDQDSIECYCGRTLREWNGSCWYTAELIRGFLEDEDRNKDR